MTDTMPDRRKRGIWRSILGLILGKDGEVSGSKIATYIAQYISAKMLLALTTPLPTWDSLAVLFTVLLAPEAYKQMMQMKWGSVAGTYRRTERTNSSVTTEEKPKLQESKL